MIHYHLSNLAFDLEGNVTFQINVKTGRNILWKGSLSVKCNGTQFEQLSTLKYWNGHC